MFKMLKRIPLWAILLSVLFAMAQAVGELTLPRLTSDIINNGVVNGDIDYIIQTGIRMIGLTFVVVIIAMIAVYIAAQSSMRLGKNLRSELFSKVIYFSKDAFDQIGQSSLITRASNDVIQVQTTMMMILRMMLISPSMMIGALIMAINENAYLARVFAVSIPVLSIVIFLLLSFVIPKFKQMQEKIDRLNLIFREGLTGVRVIRAFNKSDYEEGRYAEANADYAATAIAANTRMAWLMPSMFFILGLTNVSIAWFGAQGVEAGIVEVGNIVAFITYNFMILFSIMMLSMIFVMVPRATVAANRILAVFAIDDKIKNPNDELRKIYDVETPAHIEFDDVCFSYKGSDKQVLTGLNFSATEGETIAVIGGTGSGKSTIATLLLRFHDVTEGQVLVNGINVKNYAIDDLHRNISYVPQKANLFSGTIRSNLLYGNENATDEELWHALEVAQSADFVRELPKQLDERVEQHGTNFSGGQRQRLCIARALVKDAQIIIFDDSFSALDFKTDANLRAALAKETHDKIVFIVAQRVNTIIDANQILVLDNGRIVGQGKHDELLLTNHVYQEIVDSQMKGDR